MPLPAKSLLTLAEVSACWDMSQRDLACYALDDSLTLSIVVREVKVEVGEYIDMGDKVMHSHYLGEYHINGVFDIYGIDVWSAFQNETTTIRRLKPRHPKEYIEISGKQAIPVSTKDLHLRREEFVRFSSVHGLPGCLAGEQERAVQGGPGRSSRYDWDGFWIMACARIYNDGLPETQSMLVQELVDWYASHYETCPDSSTVKKKLSHLWRVLQRK